MSKRITIEELQSYLWNSAVLLRTNIDAGAYKQYIFPLLFFKRICDVYDEETAKAVEEYGDDASEFDEDEIHTFIVPKGYHWNDVRAVSENVGVAIVEAFRKVENANSDKLQGIFGDGAWTNKNRLPDRLLKDLLEHFSTKTLSIANCPEDELGQGYEYLIKKFADDSGHTAQEFYTNRTVVHLMTEMLNPESGESIYDPTCGSAGMLISAIAYLKEQGKEWRNVAVYGQEINALTSAIGKMNLFLHGVKDFSIVNGDTLASPAFIENGKLQQFDLCLANPPYSISQWDRAAFESDKYGRNFLGVPPQGRADYAFLQHIIASLKEDTGRCAILFPHGVLFRNEESAMREKLVRSDRVECVIGLGPNLFYNSPMEACIMICRMTKRPERRGQILFINAVNEVERKNAQSYSESRLTNFRTVIKRLLIFGAAQGIECYSSSVGKKFLEKCYPVEFDGRLVHELPCTTQYAWRTITLLNDFNTHGAFFRARRLRGNLQLTTEFQNLSDEFGDDCRGKGTSEATVYRRQADLRKFFNYLHSNKIAISEISHKTVIGFLVTIITLSDDAVEHHRRTLSLFLQFLFHNGYVSEDYSRNIPAKRSLRKNPLPSVWEHEDVDQLLSAVDRANPMGKRDYAILLLVTKLGLRVGDIRALCLGDIDWENSRLSFIQSKTQKRVDLPLSENARTQHGGSQKNER